MRFEIIKDNKERFKNSILEMWKNYLPDTSPGRYEWLNNGNPAGETSWYLAVEKRSNELAGIITVMPKELFINNRVIRAGILGDFMIKDKYRAFGPALELPKAVIREANTLGYEYLYTVPNGASKKVIERIGFKTAGIEKRFVRPIKLDRYLKAYFNKLYAPAISMIEKLYMLWNVSISLYHSGVACRVTDIDSSFDELWREVRQNRVSVMMGDHCSAYLRWRYMLNPEHEYQIIKLKNKKDERLRGYLIYYMEEGRLYVCDIVACKRSCINALIYQAIKTAYEENCYGAYISILDKNPIQPYLKYFSMLNVKSDEVNVMSWGSNELSTMQWAYFSGERNQ